MKRFFLLLLCTAWIFLTFYRPDGIFQSVGALFTYKTGLFSLKPVDANAEKIALNPPERYKLEIFVDTLGIPHIFGEDGNSAVFGLGYMHARDRAFQMEIITRLVEGSLSEILGKLPVESDKFWKPLESEKKALIVLNDLQQKHPEVYEHIMAYADGVNFYLENEKYEHQAPEFKLLGINSRLWKPHYSLFLSSYMSYMLTYDNDQISRHFINTRLPEPFRNLFEADTAYANSIIPDTLFRFNSGATNTLLSDLGNIPADDILLADEMYRKSLGSNNWALMGKKTVSGKSILCNDTHLNITLPGPWYEAHLVAPEFHVYGLGIPCSPYIISGHNENIAWGMTNAYWDVTDKYLLRLNPNNENQYWLNDHWVDFEEKEVLINVKGNEDVVLNVKYSVFGLVEFRGKTALVTRWYPAEEGNASVIAFNKLSKASNWDDFNDALRYYSYPAQNFAFADNKGNAGLLIAGKLPVRPENFRGGVQDGTLFSMVKFVPFESLPRVLNPARAFVSSANQKPGRTEYYSGYSFADIYRASRINEVLATEKMLSVDDMKSLQGDRTDISYRELIALFEKYQDNSSEWELINSLKNWDGIVNADNYEALLYHYLYLAVRDNIKKVIRPRFGIANNPPLSRLIEVLDKNEKLHLADTVIYSKQFLLQSLKNAKEALVNNHGENFNQAKYASFAMFRVQHLLKIPGWGMDVPDAGGNSYTPNVHVKNAGVSMRTIVELGEDEVNSLMIIAGGQSGRPNSLNFCNQLEDWKNINYHQSQFFKDASQLKNIHSTFQMN
jgi:penicillin G amidase